MSVHGTPDISVIVIAYNDAARLPNAVASVLEQTLKSIDVVIVDDGSTDGTGDVAEELARRHPTVRAVRLPANIGCSGGPRNVGLDLVQTPYVMFLDSDDRYLPDACATLLARATETKADIVGGRTVRVDEDTGRERPSLPHLYADAAVIDDIAKRPEQIDDTIIPGKLFRRALLTEHDLRLPEDILFGDLLFMTQAYCVSARTVLVPTTIYQYRHHDRPVDRPSITRSRYQLHNLRSRMEVNRRIDAFLRAAGRDELLAVRARRFVTHDLWLYAADLARREPAYQQEFMSLAGAHLRSIDHDALADVDRKRRMLALLVAQGDLQETLHAVTYIRRGSVPTTLHSEDGRVYWTHRHLDQPAARALLDVTDHGLHELPLAKRPLFNELTGITTSNEAFSLSGRLVNQLGVLRGPDELKVRLVLRHRHNAERLTIPVEYVMAGSVMTWSAVIDLARLPGTVAEQPIWDIALAVSQDGETNRSALWCDGVDVAGLAVPVGPRGRDRQRDRVEPYRRRDGRLAFRHVRSSGRPVTIPVPSQRSGLLAAGRNIRRHASRYLPIAR